MSYGNAFDFNDVLGSLEGIFKEADTSQKQAKRCNLGTTKEHVESIFDVVAAMQIAFNSLLR